MRAVFRMKLDELAEHSAATAELCRTTLEEATAAVVGADPDLARSVADRRPEFERLRTSAEDRAVELLALQAPVASDLRIIVGSLWIAADLHRMGMLSVSIARSMCDRTEPVLPERFRPIISRMGRVGVHLADQAITVLRTHDVEIADRIAAEDGLMDDLQRHVFAVVLDPSWTKVDAAVEMTLLARYYERFADHAVAVARHVVFLVTGQQLDAGSALPAP